MKKIKTYEGGCLCGNIRFVALAPALKPHTCSCKLCQKHSGSLVQYWVEFESSQVTWIGKGGKPATWRSTDWSTRAFCPNCGSTLGAIDDKPTLALTLGSFDSNNRKELEPQFHSYRAKLPKWFAHG